MTNLNKNSEKKLLGQLFSDMDGMVVFLSKVLIVLVIVPTILAGILLVKNSSYKKQISDLSNTIIKQNDTIIKQNSNIERFRNQILSMQFEISKYQQETSEIEKRYRALAKDKNFVESSVLKDIQLMRKNIYSLNNQIKIIEKRLKPSNQAKRDK